VDISKGFVWESVPGVVAKIRSGYVDKRNRRCNEKVPGKCEGAFVQGQSKSGKEITASVCRKGNGGRNALERNVIFYES